MHFNVLAILVSFLCDALHCGLLKVSPTGLLRMDHLLSFLQTPDREEDGFSEALLTSPGGL